MHTLRHMRSLRISGLVLGAVVAVGCSAAEETEAADSNLNQAEVVAQCMASGDAASCLSGRAQEALKAKLATVETELNEQGLFQGPSAAAGYRVRTSSECFDFANQSEVSAAWQQLSSAVDFMSEFHRARRGAGNRWFSDVRVCDAKKIDDDSLVAGGLWGGELRLKDTTLHVGVKSTLGHYSIQGGDEIRQRWDSGDQFKGTAVDDSKGAFRGKVWPAINPVGIIYVQAMPAIKSAVKTFLNLLSRVRGIADEARMKAELVAAVQSNTSVNVSLNDKKLGEEAIKAITDSNADGVRGIIDSWMSFLKDPAASEDAFDAMSAVREKMSGRACNVEIKQLCLVAVNNAHCINVSVSAGAKNISRFITTEPAPNQVQAQQTSLVCVQTNDFIEVNVDIGIDGALKSAGLANALGL